MRKSCLALVATLCLSFVSTAHGQDILLLDWASNNSYAQAAAANLGYAPTVAIDEISFNAALAAPPSGIWNAVIIDNPSNLLADPAPLATYIDSGVGGVVLNYWGADDPGYADIVTARMGAIGMVDITLPETLFCWDCADGVWTNTNLLTEVLPGVGDLWIDDGDRADTTGTGIAVGGFLSSTPAAGQVAIVRNSPVTTTLLVMGVLDGYDAVQATGMWENLIQEALSAMPAACLPVGGLSAVDPDCDTDTIDLSWTVSDPDTTSLELFRDGTSIATLGPGDTTYTDTGVADGTYTYSMIATCPMGDSAEPTSTVQSTSTGAVANVVFRLDGGAGQIDSATALETALDNAGETWIEETSLTGAFCADTDTIFWVITGTFPDNFALDPASGTALFNHASAGGKIFFEGGDTWGFDAATDFDLVDGVEDGTALDGDDSYLTMNGADSGVGADASAFAGVVYNQDQAGLDYTDQIFAATLDTLGANAGVLWTEGGGLYNTGVAYDGDNGARLICQSWEFGGFGGSQDDLFAVINTFFGAAPADCFAPSGLTISGDCDTGDQTLNWSTPSAGAQPLEDIEISRDGSVIATVDGADTSYVDSTAPDGPATYELRSLCAMSTSSSTISADTLVISGGAPANIVLRLDGGAGQIDSATAVETVIGAGNFAEYFSVADVPCIDAGTVLWAITGSFPDNFALDAVTGDFLVAHITSGGALYFEGGDTWGFDAPTSFDGYDGIEDGTALDGDDSYLSMDGVAGNIDTSDLLDVVYNQDQAGIDYTDQIQAATADLGGANSTVIWTEGNQLYNTAVAYATDDPNGNVISSSWEFGGFGGDQADLYARYVAFLGGSVGPTDPGYLRGNLNSDTGVDISDAIFGLSALFVPGSALPACAESGDVNSDGGFDISDMIFLLSSLFVPGAAQPAAPFPACAPAPAPLGCDTPQC